MLLDLPLLLGPLHTPSMAGIGDILLATLIAPEKPDWYSAALNSGLIMHSGVGADKYLREIVLVSV